MLLQDIECRIAHRAMAMTPDFIKECFFVPDQFHHPPHIRILFITSEKFQFPVACNENQRRSILANMKQRSKFINSRLKIIYAIHLPIRKMTSATAMPGAVHRSILSTSTKKFSSNNNRRTAFHNSPPVDRIRFP